MPSAYINSASGLFSYSVCVCNWIRCLLLREEPERLKIFDQPFLIVIANQKSTVLHAVEHLKRLSVVDAEHSPALFRPTAVQPMVDFDCVSRWLEDCRLHHGPACQTMDSPLAGLKLIDCQERTVTRAPTSYSYACLSYAWGAVNLNANFDVSEQLLHAIQLPSQLPRTVEDAITVTQLIRLRYLWIDRYCIAQSNAREKQRLIDNMDAVYRGAETTIIAAAGNDHDFGLPGVSSRPRTVTPSMQIQDLRIVCCPPFPKECVSDSFWNSRAWTFQESLLSRKRVVFTKEQLFVECRRMSYWESLQPNTDLLREMELTYIIPNVFQNMQQRGSLDAQDLMDDYFKLVSTYFQRQLSFDTDALNAFAGIGRFCERWAIPTFQVSRMPLFGFTPGSNPSFSQRRRDFFIAGLHWYGWNLKRRSNFPSWSWAGWSLDGQRTTLGVENHHTYVEIKSQCSTIHFQYSDGRIISLDAITKGNPELLYCGAVVYRLMVVLSQLNSILPDSWG